MSAVGKIKASRHALQRNDTAIKLYIKVVCVIYFVIIYTFILVRELQSGSNVFTVTDVPSVKICICTNDTYDVQQSHSKGLGWRNAATSPALSFQRYLRMPHIQSG